MRVNLQLIEAASDSPLWADTIDRTLTDILSVESEVAITVADQLRAKLTGEEAQVIAAKPTDNPEAYDAYLRGLAYTLKSGFTPANSLGAQQYLKEAVQLDPKFALGWSLLSYVDASGYLIRVFNQPRPSAKRHVTRPTPLFGCSPSLARLCSQKAFITTLASETTTLRSITLSKRIIFCQMTAAFRSR